MSMTTITHDPHVQLRLLYGALVSDQACFEEFRQLLSQYPENGSEQSTESEKAVAVRNLLNQRICEWIKGPFQGLTAKQVMLWRSIVVDERHNIALSPWKESNGY